LFSDEEMAQARRASLVAMLPPDRKIKRNGRDSYVTLCDFHPDNNPSMSVRKYPDGCWRYNCFACGASGDPITYLQKAKGVPFVDAVKELIALAHTIADDPPGQRIVAARYDYVDEQGEVLYQVIRYSPKDFRQRRTTPQGWNWCLADVRRVLYRLPEILAADPARTIWYVEGEKDVQSLEAKGLLATSHAGGAASWRDELLRPLRGTRRRIVVVPDCDQPGKTLMRKVFAAARADGHDVGFVLLPFEAGSGKDVTDYFDAGGTVAGLEGMIK
jgi:DNA primase